MSLVGIPEAEQLAVFQTVAAVLHLGNVSFVAGAEQDSSRVPAGPPPGAPGSRCAASRRPRAGPRARADHAHSADHRWWVAPLSPTVCLES